MAVKNNTSMAKGLKLKVIKFWGISPTFAEVIGGKLGPISPNILAKN